MIHNAAAEYCIASSIILFSFKNSCKVSAFFAQGIYNLGEKFGAQEAKNAAFAAVCGLLMRVSFEAPKNGRNDTYFARPIVWKSCEFVLASERFFTVGVYSLGKKRCAPE